jgi:hypothetical protein
MAEDEIGLRGLYTYQAMKVMEAFDIDKVFAAVLRRGLDMSSGYPTPQCLILVNQHYSNYAIERVSKVPKRILKDPLAIRRSGLDGLDSRYTPMSIQAWSTSGLGFWRYIDLPNSVELKVFLWYDTFTSADKGADGL